MFNVFKDAGAGMQDGKRGSTMDFLEVHQLLESIKV
jgi:hypothetical protein